MSEASDKAMSEVQRKQRELDAKNERAAAQIAAARKKAAEAESESTRRRESTTPPNNDGCGLVLIGFVLAGAGVAAAYGARGLVESAPPITQEYKVDIGQHNLLGTVALSESSVPIGLPEKAYPDMTANLLKPSQSIVVVTTK